MLTEGIILFKKILIGTFDNQEQVDMEIAKGEQLHPLAKHITDLLDPKISNIPKDFNGIFILEESYYHHVDESYQIKPLFFKITPSGPLDIFLESIQAPDTFTPEEMVNSNEALKFDYNELHAKELFGKALYENQGDHFLVDHHCDFGEGLHFQLTEKLMFHELQVMEKLSSNGTCITDYNTPIIYKRKAI